LSLLLSLALPCGNMWLRRFGVPHLWPSRVKVFFLGLLTSVFIFSVFQYLHSANVEYLNLRSPLRENIICKLAGEECREQEDPLKCTINLSDPHFWRGLNLSDPCPALPSSLAGQTCRNPSLPLTSIMGDLGSLHTVNSGFNPFKLWSVLFLVLTSLLTVSILIHDLALLEDSLRPKILSFPKLRYAIPYLWDSLRFVQCRRRMQRLWKRNRTVWILLIPFWTLFQAVLFMLIMYPFALLVCLFVAPVRMSRIMVFLSGILCMLWSIVFVLVMGVFDTRSYAVLWDPYDAKRSVQSCVCLCEFPLNHSVLIRIVALGVGMCWHSLSLTLRALKGLRRGQWANMFSVLHAVPIEAFPVRWERNLDPMGVGLLTLTARSTSDPDSTDAGPKSKPIKFRLEGEAIQSEPAFDPFCLMDEQPESAWMCPLIVPVSMACREKYSRAGEMSEQDQQLIWEPYTGNLETEIGCCGFPSPVFLDGHRSDGQDEDSDDASARETAGLAAAADGNCTDMNSVELTAQDVKRLTPKAASSSLEKDAEGSPKPHIVGCTAPV